MTIATNSGYCSACKNNSSMFDSNDINHKMNYRRSVPAPQREQRSARYFLPQARKMILSPIWQCSSLAMLGTCLNLGYNMAILPYIKNKFNRS